MKISHIYTAGILAAMALMAGACSDVTEPVLQKPDPQTFTLNIPPLQDQYYQLSENGTFEIVANGQPSYGFSAITSYRAQVSLTEDFADFRTLTPTGTGTLSRMTLKDADLAVALCELHGVTDESNYEDKGIQKVYFRGQAFISGIEETEVLTSNVVSLNKVQGYFVLKLPKYIFCIGNYLKDWIGPDAANAEKLIPYRVTENDDEIDSNIFHATIDFQENAPIFRFYMGLDGWDRPADLPENQFFTLGAAGGTNSDTPVEFPDFKAGEQLTHKLAETKDTFSFPNCSGVIEMTIDLSNHDAPVAHFTAK